jgi:hypothetical protein
MKPKGHRFDTTEEIQTESQRMLDTNRKLLPGSFPKMKKLGPVLHAGGNYFEGDGGR